MKNIVLTTLFAGCFVASSVMADEAKSGFDFTAKVRTGVAFAGKAKTKGISATNSSNKTYNFDVTYGTSGTVTQDAGGAAPTLKPNASAHDNSKKKSSAFIGIVLGTKYNFNNMFALGGEVFYDAMNVKFQLKKGVENLSDTAKIRGRYGIMATFAVTPLDNFSFDLGIGIAKTTKIKDLHVYVAPQDGADLTAEQLNAVNSEKFKNKVGLILKAGANYVFNQNLSLGLDFTMQKVKARAKDSKAIQFKSNLYTIGASLNYTF